MKYLLWLLRIIVGALFIFSGLVKANDPLGLAYKMNEFFEVWNMHWAMKYSLGLSVTMIAFEIIAGVAIILGYAYRTFSFLILLLTAFFTFLTAYVYLTDKIKECGCFGDCIKISNAETFWKDVILLAIVLLLVFYRKRITPMFKNYPSIALLVLSAFFAFGFQWWNLEHLPYHDCLPYKVGNNLWEKMQTPTGPGIYGDSFRTALVYRNNAGKDSSFTTANYPWQDTVNWHYVDTKTELVRKGNAMPEIKDFPISDYDGNDHTEEILKSQPHVFLFFVRNVDEARTDNIERLKALADKAEALEVPTYILSSDTRERSEAFLKKYDLVKFPLMRVDVTASKTGMRSNPGLMLLDKGVVQGKWSFRDYPAAVSMNGAKLETTQ